MEPISNLKFVENENLTEQERESIKRLRSAVYPPDAFHQRLRNWIKRRLGLAGRRYTWAPPQWSVLMIDDSKVFAGAGIIVREIISNGAPKKIGGICRVMTHPAKRGKGLATHAMREAVRLFHDELEVSYALLFCRPPLIPFYKRLQWKSFAGKVFVNQPDGRIDFTSKGPMVLDIRERAPLDGVLDLNGLPW